MSLIWQVVLGGALLPFLLFAGVILAGKLEYMEYNDVSRFVLGLILSACLGVFHWLILKQQDWAIYFAMGIAVGFAGCELYLLHDRIKLKRRDRRLTMMSRRLTH